MDGKKIFSPEWIEKIYAGWLGKVIGIRLGAPVEGWERERIARVYKEQTGYLQDYRRFAADDDSNGPLFFVRALEDSGKKALELSAQDVAEAILNYVPAGHGFFWWGGYGVSTEHTAYLNLEAGIPAPESGSIRQNGAMIAEQIGGQIFIDTWGLITPGDPDLAAKMAREASSVMHDGEGVNGGVFVAVCISYAFAEKDIRRILQKGLSYLPGDSTYRRVGLEIMDFYDAHPENWERCMEYIEAHHGYDRYPGDCHIIPNAAVMILSLLYGGGDFADTIQICCRCGWDTDCNVGNVASIMGVRCGLDGISESWRRPVNDFLACASVIGSLNNTDIPAGADYLVRQAAKIRGEALPEEWACCLEKYPVNCHFAYPGSTHAMEAYWSDGKKQGSGRTPAAPANTAKFGNAGRRCLVAAANGGDHKDEKLYLCRRTYLFPDDFSDDRYSPMFSPLVYPGQTLMAAVRAENAKEAVINSDVCADGDACTDSLTVQLYAYCARSETYVYGPPEKIPAGEWRELTWRIPEMSGRLITEVGVVCSGFSGDEEKNSSFRIFLDHLKACGPASYSVDFAGEQTENWSVFHQVVSQFTRLKGHMFLEKDQLHLSCADYGEAYTGGYDWTDYHFEASVIPVKGEHHYLSFRVQGGVRSYFAGFGPEGTLGLYKKSRKAVVCLAWAPLSWSHGKTYRISVTAAGSRIKVSACGCTLEAVDPDHPYLYGCIGFRTERGGHLACSEFSVTDADSL